jgi:uncharacterized glyoxalase superfamily protein PhnB
MRMNRSMPRCTVIPQLAYPDVVEAAAWLCEVFGFSVRIRMGDHRAQLNVGDGAIVLTKREGDAAGSSVMVRVKDIDRHYHRAVERGCKGTEPPKDFPYGERQYNVVDFAGHRWAFSESIADVAPEEWGGEAIELH